VTAEQTPPPTAGRGGRGLTYRDAGVDVDAKTHVLSDLAPTIAATHTAAVAAGVGAFAGAIRLDPGEDGFLMATTDGVGTKTLLARALGRDAVIGADIVSHCANDLVASGARPVAFLDYIAMGRLAPDVIRALIESMAAACRDLGVALLGGETAEMPDVYAGDAYDVVGTMIGLAPAGGLLDGRAVRPGQRLVGLASSGLHTNGYSLARRVLAASGRSLREHVPELGVTLGEALLRPHRCYAPAVLSLREILAVCAAAHITGGGICDNLVRVLPERCRAVVRQVWRRPAVFDWLQRAGAIPEDEMRRAFNLGVGMILVVDAGEVDRAVAHMDAAGIPAAEIGEIVAGARGVEFA
jgi:phosphoribosylformylglycinamidine cyclo-ligase